MARHIQHDDYESWLDDESRYHRDEGPAVLFKDAIPHREIYYHHGKLHRLDGYAIEYKDKYQWWYYGTMLLECPKETDPQVIQQLQLEFERLIKLKVYW